MAEISDSSDINYDELCHYMKDAEKHWNRLNEDMNIRRKQLQEALGRAEEFRDKFKQEMLWLNAADDQLTAEWKSHGLSEKCEEKIEQLKVHNLIIRLIKSSKMLLEIHIKNVQS